MVLKRLNFDDGRTSIRMHNPFKRPSLRRIYNGDDNDHRVKPEKDAFKITQEELERQPGYIKPIAPKRLT